MKTNWKKKLSEVNRRRYVIPQGWETREQVAEDLECAPDRVDKMLRPGIEEGSFEKRMFSVWDDSRRMAVQVPCYRMVDKSRGGPKQADSDLTDRIKASILRNPHKLNREIAKNFRGVSVDQVQAIRDTL